MAVVLNRLLDKFFRFILLSWLDNWHGEKFKFFLQSVVISKPFAKVSRVGVNSRLGAEPDHRQEPHHGETHYRQCAIIFAGLPRNMKGITTGIPQGSPLLPILFVIYIEPLHSCLDPTRELIISYVDDIQIMVSSPSWRTNTRLLEETYRRIKQQLQQ